MTLLYPSFLWLLLPLALLLWGSSRKLMHLVHLVILMLIVLALCRPVQEEALQETSIEAKDIIIALDVSYSMKATDITPTRYDFAKETISALLQENPADNIMLIAFTTNPLLLSPPTTDHALINVALQNLNPEFILTKGTSLKKLFTKLASVNKRHKNLILMTDGGEENDVETLTTLVEQSDISLITLALGTTQGTTIDKKDGSALKDKDGNLVVSRINPLLKRLSSSVNGTYLTASSTPQMTAEALGDALNTYEKDTQNIQKMQRHYLDLYQLPLLFALLLFLIVHTRAVKYLIIILTFFGFQAQASLIDDYHLHKAYDTYKANDFNGTKLALKSIHTPSLQSQITLGNVYYKMRAFKKAIQTYKSIRSTSTQIKQQLYYNIANAYVQLESYSEAKVYYTKVLELGVDEDAKHNLALIALLKDKKSASLGMAHPKSQNAASSKSEAEEEKKDQTRNEDQSSSGSGSGGESKSEKKPEKNKLLNDETASPHPLGSKVYELINKGYVRETQPW